MQECDIRRTQNIQLYRNVQVYKLSIPDFEKLDVCSKANEFVNDIYLLTKTFLKDEMFGLTSQLRRAAVSIPLNIAEGSARTKKDFNRFIGMARGSIFKRVTMLRISLKQEYLNQKRYSLYF